MIQFHLVEGGVIELTILKADRQAQLVALIKMESQHLALFEDSLLERAFYGFCIAQITSIEGAILKAYSGKI